MSPRLQPHNTPLGSRSWEHRQLRSPARSSRQHHIYYRHKSMLTRCSRVLLAQGWVKISIREEDSTNVFQYGLGQLYLNNQASSSQQNSSTVQNLIFQRGHFVRMSSELALLMSHRARFRPTILRVLISLATSTSSKGKRPKTPYRWRKERRGS